MKTLIAGFGSVGRRHFRNLLALGERDLILYRTRRSTLDDAEIAAETAGFPVETDLDAALAHRPEAVIVANPTALHLDVAIPAARAGSHLFLEKPISHSLERVDELCRAVQQGGGHVMVGFQLRFHPGLRLAARWIQDGELGRPLSVRAHWGEYLPGWHPWEDYRRSYSARTDLGGGPVLTLCHPFDYLRWLLGEVSQLWAFTGRVSDLEVEVEDVAEIGLRFAGGAIGSLHLDFFQQPPSNTLEITGTQGRLRWDHADGVVQLYQVGRGSWTSTAPPEGFERNQMFLEELRHFRSVVRGENAPVCTLEDGLQALRLSLAVHESACQRRLVEFQASG
jgi:predicted dehydrogenase